MKTAPKISPTVNLTLAVPAISEAKIRGLFQRLGELDEVAEGLRRLHGQMPDKGDNTVDEALFALVGVYCELIDAVGHLMCPRVLPGARRPDED